MKRFLSFAALLLAFALSSRAGVGDSRNLGEKDWGEVNNLAAANGKLYAATPVHLWEVETSGAAKKMAAPKDWGRTPRVAALDGKVYAINESRLFEIDKGRFRKLVDDIGARAMVPAGGKLYMVSGTELLAVDKEGKVTGLGGDWYNFGGMAALGDRIYIISRNRLHEVTLEGTGRPLDVVFDQPNTMVAGEGKLYVLAKEKSSNAANGTFNETRLFEVEPATGQRTTLPLPQGMRLVDTASAMTYLDGKLYLSVPTMGGRSNFFSVSVR